MASSFSASASLSGVTAQPKERSPNVISRTARSSSAPNVPGEENKLTQMSSNPPRLSRTELKGLRLPVETIHGGHTQHIRVRRVEHPRVRHERHPTDSTYRRRHGQRHQRVSKKRR